MGAFPFKLFFLVSLLVPWVAAVVFSVCLSVCFFVVLWWHD